MTGTEVIQTLRERRPAPALAEHVTCVWVQEVSPDSAAFTHRVAPHGSAEIVYALGSTPRILGPRTGPTEELLAPGTTVVGVRLRPGAASAVLGLPASELVDIRVAAGELWGDRVEALLAGARSAQEAAAMLERAVADRLAVAAPPDRIAAEAVRRLTAGRSADLAAIASSLFISERQFRRRFAAATGLGPKTLHRILRFQRFLALAWTLEQPSDQLARLAAEAGYADQAHLARESVRLEGRSPRTLLRESEQRCGCGHDHRASYGPLLRAGSYE